MFKGKLNLTQFDYVDYDTSTINGCRHYVLDNACYPSITSVLGKTSNHDWYDEWIKRVGKDEAERKSKEATDRGTNVHSLLESYVLNKQIDFEYSESEYKMFKSMIPHVNKIQEVVGQEVVLYSHQFEIAGRCDLIGYIDNELSIIDYKTSNYSKTKSDIEDYWIQTAFYAIAHNEMFNTNITNLVIIMGVNNKLPLVFKSKVNQSLIEKLNNRRNQFKEISICQS